MRKNDSALPCPKGVPTYKWARFTKWLRSFPWVNMLSWLKLDSGTESFVVWVDLESIWHFIGYEPGQKMSKSCCFCVAELIDCFKQERWEATLQECVLPRLHDALCNYVEEHCCDLMTAFGRERTLCLKCNEAFLVRIKNRVRWPLSRGLGADDTYICPACLSKFGVVDSEKPEFKENTP